MEETNKENTTTEVVNEVKAEQPVSEVAQETKVENETKSDNQSNDTSTAVNASTTDATNNATTPQETNSNVSPLYSRWRTFSFTKVIENVKKQSETVKGVYQKDLSEFVNTITTESQNLKQKINNMTRRTENDEVDVTSPDAASPNDSSRDGEKPKSPERTALYIKRNNNLINKMSTGINSLFNKNNQEVPKKKKIFDRKEALIYELQNDPLTYLIDPLYDPDSSTERIKEYKNFTQQFDLFSYHTEIDKILDEVEEVKVHHSTIVPARLPEEIFWQRYFFKLKELENSEEQKKQLVKDAAANIEEEEEIKWDSDDDEKSTEAETKKVDTTTVTNTAPVTDDKKVEDSDDDWGNWE